MKPLKISIPKPCHEDWSKMTLNEKGRFCNSCAKTVIDFTQKTPLEIKQYLYEKRHERVCGHFNKSQLDSITIEIPEQILYQKLSFSKAFLLVLLFTMGTTLFSCQSNSGQKQKIEKVILKDSIPEIITIDGEITLGLPLIEIPKEDPKFKNSKESFHVEIKKFIDAEFNYEITENLNLDKGKTRIYARFEIDSLGHVKNIRTKAPHKILEEEAKRALSKLPQLIPAQQEDKNVSINYTLPITLIID